MITQCDNLIYDSESEHGEFHFYTNNTHLHTTFSIHKPEKLNESVKHACAHKNRSKRIDQRSWTNSAKPNKGCPRHDLFSPIGFEPTPQWPRKRLPKRSKVYSFIHMKGEPEPFRKRPHYFRCREMGYRAEVIFCIFEAQKTFQRHKSPPNRSIYGGKF